MYIVLYKKFYIVFDEAEYNGDNFFDVLLGLLDSTKTHASFLVGVFEENPDSYSG